MHILRWLNMIKFKWELSCCNLHDNKLCSYSNISQVQRVEFRLLGAGSVRASDSRRRWLNTKRETLLAASRSWSFGFMTPRADKRAFMCTGGKLVCSRFDEGSESIIVHGPSSESPALVRTRRRVGKRKKKSFRLRAECNFSGIVNRYLYHSTPTLWRTILERSAYQLAWKLGLTLAWARYAFHDKAPWPRPYLRVTASTLCATSHDRTAECGQRRATRAIGSILLIQLHYSITAMPSFAIRLKLSCNNIDNNNGVTKCQEKSFR